jgi:hypothetical protein
MATYTVRKTTDQVKQVVADDFDIDDGFMSFYDDDREIVYSIRADYVIDVEKETSKEKE